MGDLYTITMDSLTTLSTKSWKLILPCPSASPAASMKYATAVQVRHDAERTPPPLVVAESHPSHIKVHKPNVSRDLGESTWQCPLDNVHIVSWWWIFGSPKFLLGGNPNENQVRKWVLPKKDSEFSSWKALFAKKRAKVNFSAISFSLSRWCLDFNPRKTEGLNLAKGSRVVIL